MLAVPWESVAEVRGKLEKNQKLEFGPCGTGPCAKSFYSKKTVPTRRIWDTNQAKAERKKESRSLIDPITFCRVIVHSAQCSFAKQREERGETTRAELEKANEGRWRGEGGQKQSE